jgi:dTMP kinase
MFIVFEGLDGSGKSTLMRAFKKSLNNKQIDFEEVFDPGGTSVGDKVREILLSKSEKPSDEAELLLYQASRAELVNKKIKPALKLSKWVVSDRFYQSTQAFQGYGRGLSLSDIDWLSHYAVQGTHPDLVVWVNTPVEVCQERLQKRKSEGEELSRLDEEKLQFHQKVYEGYEELSKQNNNNTKWLVLDGAKKPETLQLELIQYFEQKVFSK